MFYPGPHRRQWRHCWTPQVRRAPLRCGDQPQQWEFHESHTPPWHGSWEQTWWISGLRIVAQERKRGFSGGLAILTSLAEVQVVQDDITNPTSIADTEGRKFFTASCPKWTRSPLWPSLCRSISWDSSTVGVWRSPVGLGTQNIFIADPVVSLCTGRIKAGASQRPACPGDP